MGKRGLGELLGRLTHDQRRFVVARQVHPSKKKAAEAIGVAPNTVYQWPKVVDEAVDAMSRAIAEGAQALLVQYAAEAAMVKVSGLQSEDAALSPKQAIASEILDRVLGRPRERVEAGLAFREVERFGADEFALAAGELEGWARARLGDERGKD